MRRFEQECEFMSSIRHPNIVQYLGLYQDADTGLPALLMELMDDSLTGFVESCTQPIPYHIQVNICHDITVALSFLHSNNIVHRDLSSNNVLLIGNVRAKVTDFGMARLCDGNQRATQLTFTMCPGTDVYMPPEAVQDKPVYSEKIDCFSFGVITLQILTREFPKPGDRRKRIEINHPGLPWGTYEMIVPETERRQKHISRIDRNHTLLQVALLCLKDRDVEHPSAQQLCERVAALKENAEYSESVRAARERNTAEQSRSDEREDVIRMLQQQVHSMQEIIQSQASCLKEKDQTINLKDQFLSEKDEIIATKEHLVRRQQDEISRLEREKVELIQIQHRDPGQQLKKKAEGQLQESKMATAGICSQGDDGSELIKPMRRTEQLCIVVMGKRGIGKSTILSIFLGVKDFEAGDGFRHVTDEVKERSYEKNGVKVTVWDCPSLQDRTGEEEQYLRELKRRTNGDTHLMLYCIDMKETCSDLHWGSEIDKITEILGKDIWKYTAIVLTFANTYERKLRKSEKPKDVEKIFTDRVNEWQEKTQQKLKSINGIKQSTIDAIQVMPAGKDGNNPLCGQKHWLSNLWVGILNKVREDVKHAVIKINKDRFCEVQEQLCEDEYLVAFYSYPHDQPIVLIPSVQQAIECAAKQTDVGSIPGSKFGQCVLS